MLVGNLSSSMEVTTKYLKKISLRPTDFYACPEKLVSFSIPSQWTYNREVRNIRNVTVTKLLMSMFKIGGKLSCSLQVSNIVSKTEKTSWWTIQHVHAETPPWSQHPAKFSDDKPYERVVMVVIKGSYGFDCWSFSQ